MWKRLALASLAVAATTAIVQATVRPTLGSIVDRSTVILVARVVEVDGPDNAKVRQVEVLGKDTLDAVIISVVDALDRIWPDPKIAMPALQAALKDPRFSQRKEVLAMITEVYNRFR